MARRAGNGKPRKGDSMSGKRGASGLKRGIPRSNNRRDKKHSRLYELRLSHNLSQRELAERAGVSRNTVMRIENGDTLSNTAIIKKLCDTLGVEMSDFYE